MFQTYYIGIKGLIVDDNKVLILKCQNKKTQQYYWDLPGGRVENGEAILDTLQRELREEIPTIESVEVKNLVAACPIEHTFSEGQKLMLLVYKVNAHLPTVALSDEHVDYKWVDKDTFAAALKEADMNIEYQKILQQTL